LIILSIFDAREGRFILPVFVFIAVMIAEFIWSLKKVRKIFIVILILFCITGYFAISYENIFPKKLHNSLIKYVYHFNKNYIWTIEEGLYGVIDEGDSETAVRKMIKLIKDKMAKNKINRRVRILQIVQYYPIHTTFDYLTIVEKLPIKTRRPEIDEHFSFYPPEIDKGYDNFINKFDFIIVEDNVENELLHAKHMVKALQKNRENFVLLTKIGFPCPERIKKHTIACYIYQKNIKNNE